MARLTEDPGIFQGYQRVALPDDAAGGRLYIGPVEALQALALDGCITHVVSVLPGAGGLQVPMEPHRMTIEAEDDVGCNLLQHWPASCAFIDGALAAGGGVLVHCDAGSSRSGATLVAYLIHRLKHPLGECLVAAQRARSVVEPNPGFVAQLFSWERACLGEVGLPRAEYMHEIRPRLWVGALEAVQDWEELRAHSISHVLTCGRGLEVDLPTSVQRLASIGIDDLEEVDLMEHLPGTSDTIEEVLSDGTSALLVHCASGRSRSASVVLAYIMRKEGLSYAAALESAMAVRPQVQPNSGFSHQLEWYARNGCPQSLKGADGTLYRESSEFKHLLRRYSAADVRALVAQAGGSDEAGGGENAQSLQRALDALDRLQNAVPADEEARQEKRQQSQRLNRAMDAIGG